MMYEMSCEMFVVRVPTKENLADDPSRERYVLIDGMRGHRVEATLDPRFLDAKAWESLRVALMHVFATYVARVFSFAGDGA